MAGNGSDLQRRRWFRFSSMFFMAYATVSAVYRITEVGLNPLQLILVGTVLETSAFLSEIPTGVVADVHSRRLSIIIGYFLIGVGFIVEGSFAIFGTILLAQVLWGIGFTFTSGAEEAWIADEVGEQGVGSIFLRGAQVRNWLSVSIQPPLRIDLNAAQIERSLAPCVKLHKLFAYQGLVFLRKGLTVAAGWSFG